MLIVIQSWLDLCDVSKGVKYITAEATRKRFTNTTSFYACFTKYRNSQKGSLGDTLSEVVVRLKVQPFGDLRM